MKFEFFMMNRLRVMQAPINHFLAIYDELNQLKMDNTEWGVMKDYELILEASAVPCERVFSSSAEADLVEDDPEEESHNTCTGRQQQLDNILAEVLRNEKLANVANSVELFPL
ncbi:hypothetical protein OG21DRAFT_1527864 [Imleria badia]|nr:hypothetical protein OG21DRAFT_1527864 [Imleria badia]